MNKNDLLGFGLTDEQAEKVLSGLSGSFVPKNRFDEVNGQLKAAKDAVAERDGQLETLKKSTGDVETMKQTIAALQKENKEKDEAHATELAKVKVDAAVEMALSGAGAKNNKAVKALLAEFLEKAELDGDSVKGLEDAVEKLKKAEDSSFLFKESQTPAFKGVKPAEGADGAPDAHQTAFHAQYEAARKLNDTVGMVQIKMNAAEEGVFL